MRTVRFSKRDADGEVRMAKFVAQLIREGIVYKLRQDDYEYEVEPTGF
jgi:hypothetical protein